MNRDTYARTFADLCGLPGNPAALKLGGLLFDLRETDGPTTRAIMSLSGAA